MALLKIFGYESIRTKGALLKIACLIWFRKIFASGRQKMTEKSVGVKRIVKQAYSEKHYQHILSTERHKALLIAQTALIFSSIKSKKIIFSVDYAAFLFFSMIVLCRKLQGHSIDRPIS
jgi:hypothetical protein